MKKELWVYVSLAGGQVDSMSEALLAKAQELAGDGGFELCAVLAGRGTFEAAKALASSGIPKVYWGENEDVLPCEYARIAKILLPFVKEHEPEIFLFPATDSASIIASTLGVHLQTGVNVHCISAKIRDGIFIGAVPAFGGQVMSEILCPQKKPQMATVRLSGGAIKPAAPGEVIRFSADCPALPGIRLISAETEATSGVSLADAEVVVCCGAGMADAEGWQLANKLADRLGGAACCTRNALDMQCGATEKNMVGISGTTVSPKVYIGFGVSGSAHHMCGMRDSGMVININRDAANAFFKSSDYGLVGDAKNVAKALLNALA